MNVIRLIEFYRIRVRFFYFPILKLHILDILQTILLFQLMRYLRIEL